MSRLSLLLTVLLLPAAVLRADDGAAPAKPGQPVPTAGAYSWEYGPFQYDPSGNVAIIGTDSFVYDPMGRLVQSSIGKPGEPLPQTQSYEYDVYGNRTKVNLTTTPVDVRTNRLTAVSYDTAGNATAYQPSPSVYQRVYTYDALNMATEQRVTAGAQDDRWELYVYTADDERLWTLESVPPSGQNISHWTLRDLGGKVLRDFVDDGTDSDPDWHLFREYVYRDGQLLAANTETGTQHYSLDHLGTPRLITDGNRNVLFSHYYFPFGEEWLDGNGATDQSTLRFTGHERDEDLRADTQGTLDYMHARSYSASVGRFTSVDTAFGNLHMPQLFNRYSYALNNPERFIDPDGRQITVSIGFTYVPDDSEPADPRTDSEIWSDFWGDFFWFASGVMNSVGSDNLFGRGRKDLPNNQAYSAGQVVGDGIAIVGSGLEMVAGAGGEVGGTLLDLSGIGVAIGVPVQVVSGTLIVHGGFTTAISTTHLMSGIKQRKDGSLGQFKGTDSKSAENKRLRDAMTAAGHGGDKDKQRLIHEAIQGLPKMSFKQLVQFIRDFFN